MGLDMFAMKTKQQPQTEVDFEVVDQDEVVEFYYWRKHPKLHGWMQDLYNAKGGKELFNCVNVQLTHEDLIALERDLNSARLPLTNGPFFGQSHGSLEEIEYDEAFIKEAREAIEQGYTVYYTSWW